MKQPIKFIITTLLLASAINAKAVVVSLDPASQNIQVGDQVNLNVLYDLESATIAGGAFSIDFDTTAFDFVSFTFDSNLPDDPSFRIAPGVAVLNNSFNLGFGGFTALAETGNVGSLIFESKLDGNFDFTVGEPLGAVPGTPDSIFREGGSQVNAQVQVSAVPLPGAIWLLMSAFASLSLMTQLRRSS